MQKKSLKQLGIAALSIAALIVAFVLTRHSAFFTPGLEAPSPGMNASARAHTRNLQNAVLNAPLPPSKGRLRIRGKVIDSVGPVADAIVTATGARGGEVLSELNCQCGNECGRKLLECGCGEAARQLFELVVERRGEAQPLARTQSTQDGSFELSGFEVERVTLWAEKAGVGIGVRQGVEAGEELADVTLQTGISITGKIADENGNPVPNALVTAIFSEHSRFFDAIASEVGEFSISPAPLGRYRLVASARGLLPADGWATTDAHSDLSLELLRPRRVAGKVLRAGTPIAQAQVQIDGEHHKASLSSTQDGSFTFSDLRPGTYDLTARTGTGGAHLSLEVQKNDLSDLVLELDKGVVLEGVVKDSSAAPIAKAKVTISRRETTVSGGTAPTHQSTDGTGRFRADLFEAGEYNVDVLAQGFVRVDGMRTAVERGQTAQLAITLERASKLGGIVVDASGKPVANATLQVSRSRIDAMDSWHKQENQPDEAGFSNVSRGTFSNAKSTKEGTFQFDYLRDGEYMLSAEHEGFIQVTAKPVQVPDTAVRIVMEEGATVSGVVLGKSDVPQPNVTVYLEKIEESEYLYPGWKKYATTDDRGNFQIKAVEEGKYLVLASQAVGKARTGMRTASVRVTVQGSRSSVVTLRFEGTASMSGIVIDAAGNALAGAKVTAYPHRGQKGDGYPYAMEMYEGMASTTAQEDGTFEIDSLRPGKYRLRPEKKGFVPQDDQGSVASAGDTHVRLVMNPLGTVRGRVLDPTGAPIHNFAVNREQFSESTGQFSLPVYSTGDLTLRIHAPGWAVERRQVKAIVGEDVTVPDITLSTGRMIRGKVLDAANSSPVSGALVDKGPIDDSPSRLFSPAKGSVYTNSDGSFSLLEAESGPVQLVVEHSKYRQYRGVIAPDQSEATILLLAGSSLLGRVLDSDQKPLAGARVNALGGQMNFKVTETNGDGSYEMDGLEAGRYTVSVSVARLGNGAPSFMSRQVDLPVTGATQLDFVAPKDGATLQITIVDQDVGSDRGPTLLLAQGEVDTPRTATDWLQFGTPFAEGIQESGATIFRGLEAGHYTLFVLKSARAGMGVHRETLDIGSGQQKSIRINLPAQLPVVSFIGEH